MTFYSLLQRHRTGWNWRLKLYLLIALALAVYVYGAQPTPTVADKGSVQYGDGRAVAPPINVATQGNTERSESSHGPREPASAAPIWGVTKHGTAYVLTINPPCKPACREPVVTEFVVRLTKERL